MINKEEQKKLNALRRRRKLRQLLGAVVCLFVVAGVVSTVLGGVQLYRVLTDDTAEREEFASRVSTLVALDPVPFDSLEEANKSVLMEACIWRVREMNPDRQFEENENGACYIPRADIEVYIKELYGETDEFTFASFTIEGMEYQYDKEKEAYIMPITGVTGNFYPKAVKIQKEKDAKRVTIAYISQFTSGGGFTVIPNETPQKYYDYIFTKQEDGGYYLTAIVDSEMKPEESSSSESTSAVFMPGLDDSSEFLTPEDSSSDVTIGDSFDPTIGDSFDSSVTGEDDGASESDGESSESDSDSSSSGGEAADSSSSSSAA